MSKHKKSKKLRRPNLAAVAGPAAGRAGGQEIAIERPVASRGQALAPSDSNFDYTYVIKDLRRIGILAGSFIAVLVALAFIIK